MYQSVSDDTGTTRKRRTRIVTTPLTVFQTTETVEVIANTESTMSKEDSSSEFSGVISTKTAEESSQESELTTTSG